MIEYNCSGVHTSGKKPKVIDKLYYIKIGTYLSKGTMKGFSEDMIFEHNRKWWEGLMMRRSGVGVFQVEGSRSRKTKRLGQGDVFWGIPRRPLWLEPREERGAW